MQLARRFRLPAVLCAFAVLACALIARPYAEMGVSDDGTYILIAQHLASTGHIVYNGWETPILGAQLFLGAAFIKLFGFSFTVVRMSTLMVALLLAFILQRTLVRADVHERNATIGTLAFVLSPLYLMLSVTYMTDIFGLFAVVLCLYGCLRALQSQTDRTTIAWLCFAVATNAVFGTARQIAWLGVLVMVPSALFLLRARRRVLIAGLVADLVGAFFILVCVEWFFRQPYNVHERLIVHRGSEFDAMASFFHAAIELPLLLLPIVLLFLPELRRNIRRSAKVAAVASAAYILILLALRWRPVNPHPLLEPTLRDWISRYDGYGGTYLSGKPTIVLDTGMRLGLTIASLGGLLGLIVSLLHPRQILLESGNSQPLSWKQLGILVAPFAAVYTMILIPRAASATAITGGITDRYLLELLVVALPCMLRFYQERIQLRLPTATLLLIAIPALYGVALTHDIFAVSRACVKIAAGLRTAGVPDTSVSYGWEYDYVTEVRNAGYVNDFRIVLPAHAYAPAPPLPDGTCVLYWHDATPHVRPIYGLAFDPNACYGPAPFAPVHYSRWLASAPGAIYVVRYLPQPAG